MLEIENQLWINIEKKNHIAALSEARTGNGEDNIHILLKKHLMYRGCREGWWGGGKEWWLFILL